eukprot:jgi/Phyca11/14852/fgenesh1_pg.PHYCAscaffold_9_\
MESVSSASEPDAETTEANSSEDHVPASSDQFALAPRMELVASECNRRNYFVKSTGCQAQMTVSVAWDAVRGFHVKFLRKKAGKNVTLRDVHNMVAGKAWIYDC